MGLIVGLDGRPATADKHSDSQPDATMEEFERDGEVVFAFNPFDGHDADSFEGRKLPEGLKVKRGGIIVNQQGDEFFEVDHLTWSSIELEFAALRTRAGREAANIPGKRSTGSCPNVIHRAKTAEHGSVRTWDKGEHANVWYGQIARGERLVTMDKCGPLGTPGIWVQGKAISTSKKGWGEGV